MVSDLILPELKSCIEKQKGNVTLNLKVGDLILGNATILNTMLKPGNNSVYTRGIVDIKTGLKNIEQLIYAEADALKRGNIAVSASGNSTIFDGKHIDYYETVLNDLTIDAEMPITSLLIDSLGGLVGDLGGGLGKLLGGLNVTNILNLIGG
jgi:hypothetical protein